MFEDERVIWASIDGRWRNDYRDETIKFSEENGKMIITQVFEDGSESKDVFKKGD